MRVVLVTSWFMSLNRPYISPYLHEFICSLQSAGIGVSVYAPRPSFKPKFSYNPSVRVRRAIGPLGFGAFLGEILRSKNVLVHVQRPNTYAAPFIITARLLRKPVVVTIHLAEVLPYHPMPWSFLRRFVLSIVDRAICVSGATRKLAIESGCPPDRAVIIYNSVNQERFKPRSSESTRRTLGLPLKDNILLYLGDLRREKQCNILLNAFASLQRSCYLLVLGDGPIREELTSLAYSLGISERVIFLGRLPLNSELLQLYYNAADVFVLPSLNEGHSLALLEALSSGLPVVATRVGGNIETVEEGKNGLLVSPSSVIELGNALMKLLDGPAMRESMAVAARESLLRRFSRETQIARTTALYQSLMEDA